MKHCICLLALLLYPLPLLAQQSEDEAAIRSVLVDSYVEGIHVNREEEAVRRGFHPEFLMHAFDDGDVIQVDLDYWLDHLQLDGVKSEDVIEYTFESIDIAGNSATVKMEIYENTEHIYTDYFGLYKLDDVWKIVNKIFYSR